VDLLSACARTLHDIPSVCAQLQMAMFMQRAALQDT
jgi:hypothetical protein